MAVTIRGSDIVFSDGSTQSSGVSSSKSSNGYVKTPDGVIIQWGYGQGSYYASNPITFPTAFPNVCTSVVATAWGDGIVYIENKNNTSFVFHDVAEPANDVLWIAIGY